MSVLFQINSVVNTGSTGRIVEGIGQAAIHVGWKSYIAYGRYSNLSQSELIKIGNKWDVYNHVLQTRLFDRHGLASKRATKRLIRLIEEIKPDVIHLHNIHGYYLNYPILFTYLSKSDIPVVWTLHDCWPFTGHCAYFVRIGCEKWETACMDCPAIHDYPKSFSDRSHSNYSLKEELYGNVSNIYVVSVSKWLDGLVGDSFLQKHPHTYIYNGIDTDVFSPQTSVDLIREKYGIHQKYVLLGVATAWGERKGLYDYYALRNKLSDDYVIVLVGVSDKIKKSLPQGIIGVSRTENQKELACFYSLANVVLNLSYAETFGLTTIEGFSCGTPSIVYNCTASPELISEDTGFIVESGNIESLRKSVEIICQKGKETYSKVCRDRAVRYFNKEERFQEYIDLYNQILSK